MTQISTNKSKYDFTFKLILIGGNAVGKTCLLSRFVHNKFPLYTESTIGNGYAEKQFLFNGKKLKIEVLDTPGQDNYRTLVSSSYGDRHGALAVFDLTQLYQFDAVVQWIGDFRQTGPAGVPIILVGNKSDLVNQRKVSREQATALAQELNLLYIETSALDGSNVEEAFIALISPIYNKQVPKPTDTLPPL